MLNDIALRNEHMKKNELHPIHPGEVLLEEFLKPMDLSQNKLALNIGVPARRINEIVLTVVLAYLNSFKKSLINTSSQFEKVAGDLETETETVREKSTTLQNVDQAVGLFTGLARLASFSRTGFRITGGGVFKAAGNFFVR
jgi:hypothetical protein